MCAQTNVAPIIIKRKKVISGGGHHGGAWKVAYADFVTAMMAFFLLMWLLNATTEQQRKGIADYFTPTVPINRISGGGDGMFGGDSVFSENTLAKNGSGGLAALKGLPSSELGTRQDDPTSATDEAVEGQYGVVQDFLIGGGGESLVSDNSMKHVLTRVTDEGLVIEIFDLETLPLFAEGGDSPQQSLVDLTRMISQAIQLVSNEVAVEAHTRSEPIVIADNQVWGLSSSRADRVRLLLEGQGIDTQRIARVTGHADRELANPNPLSVRNNRLEIILLRSDQ